MTLGNAEIGFYVALSIWVVGFLVAVQALVARRPGRLIAAVWLAAIGLVPHTAGTVVRWIASGRPPFISLYELILASAWFAVVVYLVSQAVWRAARPAVVAVLPVAFLSMGAALTASPAANPLGATPKSWWLVIHILFAMVAHGCFAVAFGASLLLLIKKDGEGQGLIPSADALDRVAAQSIVYGFICDTVMVLSGGIWAHQAWGRFWGWDPVETWSLITWLLYGLYAHLRFLPRWRGRRAAVYAVAAFVVVVFSFWGVPHLWESQHDYTLSPR